MENSISKLLIICLGILAASLLLTAVPVLANVSAYSTHIGRLSYIQKGVKLSQNGRITTPAINDKIFAEQTILTKDGSKAVIKFRDGSKFVVGPNSEVKLEEFQFNPAESHTVNNINVLKGAFQFNSGFAVKLQQ